MSDWQPIETAPKDKPILAWCDHESDPYYSDGGAGINGKLTIYAAHAKELSYADTGFHIIEWGGETEGGTEEDYYCIPDWWFVVGSDFEKVANPTHWMPLPEPPTPAGEKE
jgi:hypothetical protein